MADWNQWLPRLLAGNDRLTRFEKERIFQGVWAQIAAESRPARRPWFLALATVSVAAAALLTLPMFRGSEFSARGGVDEGHANHFQVYCIREGQRGACRQGSKLLFELHPSADRGFFAAFSRRSDGTVIWYFPVQETGTSLHARQAGAVTTGFVLGTEHSPGTYRVYGLFSEQPLSRDDVRAQAESSPSSLVERAIEVAE